MKRIGQYVGVGGIVLIETDPVTESNTRNVIRCDKINLYKIPSYLYHIYRGNKALHVEVGQHSTINRIKTTSISNLEIFCSLNI